MILNQWTSDNCWTFAICWILQHYWVQFDFESVSKIREPLIMKLQNRFISLWLVKHFISLPNTRLVDLWLARWEHLLTGTKRGDFSLFDNVWWVVEFDEWTEHYLIICENLWDKYKLQNSWGESYGDKWYCYMKKSDFSKLFAPRRLVISKKSI